MIPELGHFALIVALFVALALGSLPMVGAARNDFALMAMARPAARMLFEAQTSQRPVIISVAAPQLCFLGTEILKRALGINAHLIDNWKHQLDSLVEVARHPIRA